MLQLVLSARDERVGQHHGARRHDLGCFLLPAVDAAYLGGCALSVGRGGEGVHLAYERALGVVEGVGNLVGHLAHEDVDGVGTASEGKSIVDHVDDVVVKADDVFGRV